MKATLFTLIFSITSSYLFAQELKLSQLLQGKTNFIEIENIANEYFSSKDIRTKGLFEDNEYVKYQRWQWQWKSRVNADGSFPDLNAQYEIYKNLNGLSGSNKKNESCPLAKHFANNLPRRI
jgi:hypothetical protein